MKKRQAKVTEVIRAQEKAEVSSVEELILTLEQEISDLKRRRDELGQLSEVEDDIYFIQVSTLTINRLWFASKVTA